MADQGPPPVGSLRGLKAELSPDEPQGKAPLATFEGELNVRLREPDEVLVRPAVRRRTSNSRDRAASKEARRRNRLAAIQKLEQEDEEAAAAAAAADRRHSATCSDDFIREEEEKEDEGTEKKDEEKAEEDEEDKPGFFDSYFELLFEVKNAWPQFKEEHDEDWKLIRIEANRCFCSFVILFLFCGFGGFIFRFTESTFEQFYKCGVKRVKRDFIEGLWVKSQQMREEEWKSMARRKLWEFEDQLQAAFDAGINSYSGQKSWSFLNAVVYCITIVTTIGYGHITPSTNTGKAVTIIYAIFGIPLFLILLADFGKMFTRAMKFLWAFVRRLYYTGSCRKVRHTAPVQEVMKGVQMVYDIARFQKKPGETNGHGAAADPEVAGAQLQELLTVPGVGPEPPTPAPSNFDIDDEFNLPISVAFVILVIYILVGATLYCMWEDWTFFEAFYFVFISMSTIGFGDYVPKHPMFMMGSIVYLVFGLALTSMCINVVQLKLSDSFRQASSKIGASFGLRLAAAAAEEEARTTPGQVELAEVHHATAKKASEENLDGLSMETQ
ncbi:TWiK family of potassium channels protein 7 isoform X1 [Cloeon dipterum]|uniref:TWiK family of potassium channels protein 7 isoform X1 n=1 Tax=Cloeon dipterum TaxID=197152 RepID=UPI00321FDF79